MYFLLYPENMGRQTHYANPTYPDTLIQPLLIVLLHLCISHTLSIKLSTSHMNNTRKHQNNFQYVVSNLLVFSHSSGNTTSWSFGWWCWLKQYFPLPPSGCNSNFSSDRTSIKFWFNPRLQWRNLTGSEVPLYPVDVKHNAGLEAGRIVFAMAMNFWRILLELVLHLSTWMEEPERHDPRHSMQYDCSLGLFCQL